MVNRVIGARQVLHTPISNDMVSHMKTTVEVSDALLEEAKSVARKESTTVRALIEEGLREALKKRKRKSNFRLRKSTYRGNGLQPGLVEGSWEKIRDLAYEGRGT